MRRVWVFANVNYDVNFVVMLESRRRFFERQDSSTYSVTERVWCTMRNQFFLHLALERQNWMEFTGKSVDCVLNKYTKKSFVYHIQIYFKLNHTRYKDVHVKIKIARGNFEKESDILFSSVNWSRKCWLVNVVISRWNRSFQLNDIVVLWLLW